MKNFIKDLNKVIDEFGGEKHIKGCIIALNFDNGGKRGTDAYLTINGKYETIMGHILAIIMQAAAEQDVSPLEFMVALERGALEAMHDKDIIDMCNKGENK